MGCLEGGLASSKVLLFQNTKSRCVEKPVWVRFGRKALRGNDVCFEGVIVAGAVAS